MATHCSSSNTSTVLYSSATSEVNLIVVICLMGCYLASAFRNFWVMMLILTPSISSSLTTAPQRVCPGDVRRLSIRRNYLLSMRSTSVRFNSIEFSVQRPHKYSIWEHPDPLMTFMGTSGCTRIGLQQAFRICSSWIIFIWRSLWSGIPQLNIDSGSRGLGRSQLLEKNTRICFSWKAGHRNSFENIL